MGENWWAFQNPTLVIIEYEDRGIQGSELYWDQSSFVANDSRAEAKLSLSTVYNREGGLRVSYSNNAIIISYMQHITGVVTFAMEKVFSQFISLHHEAAVATLVVLCWTR